MELKIFSPKDDGFVKSIEWNHEDIKAEISEKVEHYKNLVYADDQIKEAKADRAKLRKFVEALEAKRKEVKKQCLAPYEDFEKKIKEIIAIIDEPIDLIDEQVKGYENSLREKKKKDIEALFAGIGFQRCVTLEKIFDDKWLNAPVSLKKIESEMIDIMHRVSTDLFTLEKLPEFSYEACEIYKETLDMNIALAKASEMAEMARKKAEHEAMIKAKEEEERVKAENNPPENDAKDEAPIQAAANEAVDSVNDEPRQWIAFKAYLTVKEARELKEFFKSRGIKFGPVK